jgi:hypothetical protein
MLRGLVTSPAPPSGSLIESCQAHASATSSRYSRLTRVARMTKRFVTTPATGALANIEAAHAVALAHNFPRDLCACDSEAATVGADLHRTTTCSPFALHVQTHVAPRVICACAKQPRRPTCCSLVGWMDASYVSRCVGGVWSVLAIDSSRRASRRTVLPARRLRWQQPQQQQQRQQLGPAESSGNRDS